MLQETEYILEQYYCITFQEKEIDKEFANYRFASDSEAQEEKSRFHRMFQAVRNNEEALAKVLEYLVLYEQDDGYRRSSYVDEYYKREISFFEILMSIQHCFVSEDRQELFAWKDDLDGRDWFDPIKAGFRIQASGFTVEEHRCVRKEV